MNRPSFQFYPGDWTKNAKLKLCSKSLKGNWIDTLCLMHDSDEYGVIRCSLKDLANAIGAKLSDLKELHDKGVLKGADVGAICRAYVHVPRHAGKSGEPVTLIPEQPGPIWYSSRMVLDEWLRTRRGASTRFTAENNPSRSPTGRHGDTAYNEGSRSPTRRQGNGATSSSSSSKDLDLPKSETGGDAPGDKVKGDDSGRSNPPRKAVDLAREAFERRKKTAA